MKMPSIFAIGKVISVGIVSMVLLFNSRAIMRIQPFSPQVYTQGVNNQVIQQGQQISDIERRVLALEQANYGLQLATIQSQLNIDHQFLMGILFMMITLAAEAVWRVAEKRKRKESE